MSRDNYVFFMTPEFPHSEWSELLATFGAVSRPIDDLQKRHCVTNEWSFDGVDGSVFVDLIRISADRHIAPKDCGWRIGIHCNGHRGIHHWFLYSIPLLAIARLANTAFFDPHGQTAVAACDLAGIETRMHSVLPHICPSDKLVACGFTAENDAYWPRQLARNSAIRQTATTRNAMLHFCADHGVICISEESSLEQHTKAT